MSRRATRGVRVDGGALPAAEVAADLARRVRELEAQLSGALAALESVRVVSAHVLVDHRGDWTVSALRAVHDTARAAVTEIRGAGQ